jgi:hemerythrin-like domain-containing protein
MPVVLGSKPQADFAQPLDLLSDCHRRIEHFLDVLAKVVSRTRGATPDAEHRRAIETALTYFEQAAPKHNADEEESLFPRLREAGKTDPRVSEVMAKVDALEADHQAADAALAEVRAWFQRWLEIGTLAPAQVHRLDRLLSSLKQLYSRHIATEDNEVFRLAAQVLDAQDLQAVGQEMAQRRGLTP